MTVPAADNLRRWVFTFGYNDDDPPGLAVDLLVAIDALHQPDQRIYCTACCDRWPCRTARLLHPEEADRG
jgi:hypothetical protein